jgi:RNA-directed DNA polymerase
MFSLQEISSKIGISSGYLFTLLRYHNKYYKTYYIKKRSGGLRKISTPNIEIKAIQGWILRNYLDKLNISERATGFVLNRNIRLNASYHLNQKYIMCLDIKEFFPSIKIDRIREILVSLLNDALLADFISEISTFNLELPQGGVTSPALSNIVFKPLDEKIIKLCNGKGIIYSRYADDMCFSSNYLKGLVDLKSIIIEILKEGQFELNEKKTRFMTGKNRKIVTGLFLNSDRITVGRDKKRYVRSSLYHYFVKGDSKDNINKIYGMISYISGIEFNYKKNITDYIVKLKGKVT